MNFFRPILYGYWSSSSVWRVRIALQYKGIDYEVRPVKREDLKNLDFVRLNPTASVPVLVHGKSILSESLAIIEFLEEEYLATKKLLPGDSFNKAMARSLALNIVCGVQPLQNKKVQEFVEQKGIDGKEWAQHFINQGFTTLERRLQRTAGTYCIGDEVSLPDACLVPQVYNAINKYDLELGAFPNIRKINENLEKIPAFQRAHANCQPDTPAEMRLRGRPNSKALFTSKLYFKLISRIAISLMHSVAIFIRCKYLINW
ncbi:Gstz1 [Aphelenchoides bicaudatus]|nr:Gstz1 [Aphelenchoides bicaudatus]